MVPLFYIRVNKKKTLEKMKQKWNNAYVQKYTEIVCWRGM